MTFIRDLVVIIVYTLILSGNGRHPPGRVGGTLDKGGRGGRRDGFGGMGVLGVIWGLLLLLLLLDTGELVDAEVDWYIKVQVVYVWEQGAGTKACREMAKKDEMRI